MWSGPRNISTAMMRSFGNRADTVVSDEPFYAAYLAASGADHPLRAETLASQPTDCRDVAAAMMGPGPVPGAVPGPGPTPGGATVWYQKQMCHHMLPGFGLDWLETCTSAFLIRRPEQVLASYAAKRTAVTLADIGVARQVEIFDRVADRLGSAPPVIDGADVLANPRGMLGALCAAIGVRFDDAMLAWPAGRRDTDGAWAPAWYDAVERSTGFAAPTRVATTADLPDAAKPIAAAAMPYYERMARYRLAAAPPRVSR